MIRCAMRELRDYPQVGRNNLLFHALVRRLT